MYFANIRVGGIKIKRNMKNYFTIILLILLCGCINSNKKATTSNRVENIQKKYRNYEFDVTINVEHSGNDFKYLINVNKSYDINEACPEIL